MTTRRLVTALTFCFLAFTFLAHQQTTAQAADCPPGQTDQLEDYKGICMDPKRIDPQHRRLKEASKCPPGQTDRLKNYKGTCMDPKRIDPETGRLKEASKCPPGQTDKLKDYKGVCMPIEAGNMND